MEKVGFIESDNSTDGIIIYIIIMYAIFIFAFIGLFFSDILDWRFFIFIIVNSLFLFPAYLSGILDNSRKGIFIYEDKIYKSGAVFNETTDEIDKSQFKAVRIIKARGTIGPIKIYSKDENKNQLYSMIYVNEIKNGMDNIDLWSCDFYARYEKSIICHTVYNEEFLNKMKHLIPDMQIISDIHQEMPSSES